MSVLPFFGCKMAMTLNSLDAIFESVGTLEVYLSYASLILSTNRRGYLGRCCWSFEDSIIDVADCRAEVQPSLDGNKTVS